MIMMLMVEPNCCYFARSSSAMIIMLSSWNLNIATVVLSLLKQIDCMLLCICSEIDDR